MQENYVPTVEDVLNSLRAALEQDECGRQKVSGIAGSNSICFSYSSRRRVLVDAELEGAGVDDPSGGNAKVVVYRGKLDVYIAAHTADFRKHAHETGVVRSAAAFDEVWFRASLARASKEGSLASVHIVFFFEYGKNMSDVAKALINAAGLVDFYTH